MVSREKTLAAAFRASPGTLAAPDTGGLARWKPAGVTHSIAYEHEKAGGISGCPQLLFSLPHTGSCGSLAPLSRLLLLFQILQRHPHRFYDKRGKRTARPANRSFYFVDDIVWKPDGLVRRGGGLRYFKFSHPAPRNTFRNTIVLQESACNKYGKLLCKKHCKNENYVLQ